MKVRCWKGVSDPHGTDLQCEPWITIKAYHLSPERLKRLPEKVGRASEFQKFWVFGKWRVFCWRAETNNSDCATSPNNTDQDLTSLRGHSTTWDPLQVHALRCWVSTLSLLLIPLEMPSWCHGSCWGTNLISSCLHCNISSCYLIWSLSIEEQQGLWRLSCPNYNYKTPFKSDLNLNIKRWLKALKHYDLCVTSMSR